jgi:hypothetical protein
MDGWRNIGAVRHLSHYYCAGPFLFGRKRLTGFSPVLEKSQAILSKRRLRIDQGSDW